MAFFLQPSCEKWNLYISIALNKLWCNCVYDCSDAEETKQDCLPQFLCVSDRERGNKIVCVLKKEK